MDAPGDMVSCSLRSNGSFDVSVIAKKYDGGGHKNAAGFQVKMLELLSWML
jgi:nanoRNase/pAp phosphatase (c-di-AMP/oligoRNAs hydrolase)